MKRIKIITSSVELEEFVNRTNLAQNPEQPEEKRLSLSLRA